MIFLEIRLVINFGTMVKQSPLIHIVILKPSDGKRYDKGSCPLGLNPW